MSLAPLFPTSSSEGASAILIVACDGGIKVFTCGNCLFSAKLWAYEFLTLSSLFFQSSNSVFSSLLVWLTVGGNTFSVDILIFFFKFMRTKASVLVFSHFSPKRKILNISLWELIENLWLITYCFVQNIVLKFWPGVGCGLFFAVLFPDRTVKRLGCNNENCAHVAVFF